MSYRKNLTEFLICYNAELIDIKRLTEYEQWAMNFFIQQPVVGDPYSDVTIQLDITEAYANYTNHYAFGNSSFFAFLIWKIKKCINQLKSLNYRYLDGQWYYFPDPPIFIPYLSSEEERFKNILLENVGEMTKWEEYIQYYRNVIDGLNIKLHPKMGGHYYHQIALFFLNLPKIKFTAYKVNSLNVVSAKQSFVLGQRYEENKRLFQPLYIHTHHANSDGFILSNLITNIEREIIS